MSTLPPLYLIDYICIIYSGLPLIYAEPSFHFLGWMFPRRLIKLVVPPQSNHSGIFWVLFQWLSCNLHLLGVIFSPPTWASLTNISKHTNFLSHSVYASKRYSCCIFREEKSEQDAFRDGKRCKKDHTGEEEERFYLKVRTTQWHSMKWKFSFAICFFILWKVLQNKMKYVSNNLSLQHCGEFTGKHKVRL